jgi:hypothetical protein
MSGTGGSPLEAITLRRAGSVIDRRESLAARFSPVANAPGSPFDSCFSRSGLAWLGLAAFHPVLTTFWDGQLAALWLAVFVIGYCLVRSDRSFAAGLVFSVLALKPQLTLGPLAWLVLRRDVRGLSGFAAGLALQILGVGLLLGWNVWHDYLTEMPRLYPVLDRVFRYNPSYQISLSGILSHGFGIEHKPFWLALHVVVALWAGWRLARVVWLRPESSLPLQFAAATTFGLVAAPHLLVYDLSLLLVPLAFLVDRSADRACRRDAVLTYAVVALSPLYSWLGFSLAPLALLWLVHRFGRLAASAEAAHQDDRVTSALLLSATGSRLRDA